MSFCNLNSKLTSKLCFFQCPIFTGRKSFLLWWTHHIALAAISFQELIFFCELVDLIFRRSRKWCEKLKKYSEIFESLRGNAVFIKTVMTVQQSEIWMCFWRRWKTFSEDYFSLDHWHFPLVHPVYCKQIMYLPLSFFTYEKKWRRGLG